MHRPTRSLLLATAASLLAIGCTEDESDFCFATDEAGVVSDSVRPDPGYVCVASVQRTPAGTDSVRPDPGASIKLQSVRRGDVR